MYINIELFNKSGLQPQDVYFLAGIKQIDKGVLETLNGDVFTRLEALSLLTSVKGKKGDNPVYNIRLSDKGKELLKDLEEAPINEDDKKVGEWLCNYYLNAGKVIGNKKKLFRHIKDFRIKSGVEKNNLIKLCVAFLQENEERSNKLEFVFFHPKNVFEVKLDLDGSWLYQFYLENKEKLDASFEEY